MQHKCKVTVLKKELFKDLQEEYLLDPESSVCPFYEEGQEFIFERYKEKDDFWTMGKGSQCSEAWDCISRYIYTALQGGSIMNGWTNDPRIMIACCNDGTRPVIFKIERIDYKVLYIDGISNDSDKKIIKDCIIDNDKISDVLFTDEYTEVILDDNVEDEYLKRSIESAGNYVINKID